MIFFIGTLTSRKITKDAALVRQRSLFSRPVRAGSGMELIRDKNGVDNVKCR